MKITTDPDWLIRMAEKEGHKIVSVGGLVGPIEVNFGVDTSKAIKTAEWSQLFPVSTMRKLRFSLPEGDDAAALLKFFDVQSPAAWGAKWGNYAVAFRQTQRFDIQRVALAAWVREAEIIAGQIVLAEFDEAKLRASLDDLRRVTRGDVQDGLDKAQDICAKAGVALVVVPELPGTRISGCARWLDERHAMVGLTLRYRSADQLWFTFFHELGHILLHRTRRMFVIDNAAEQMGDDVVDSDMAKYEAEADEFSRDALIPPDALKEFLRAHGSTLTNEEVHDFAESVEIGPGVVIGRLQHDGILQHWQGNKLKQFLNWGFAEE